MKKWIWVIIITVLIAGFVVWQRSGTKTAYVNGLPEYTNLPNREYIFERDCYLFKFNDRNTSYPLVGANAPETGLSVPELPQEVTEKNIGLKTDKVRILEVVRTGSRFKIISVRRDENKKATTITFEILFMDEAQRKYPRMDAYYIMDHSPEALGKAPSILLGYAVERVKG
jgi:hypothetical protein